MRNVDSPFDSSGIETGADGIKRYAGLPRNVVRMLQATVEQHGDRTAVVELGGASVTYAELWDRAHRVAGGLRDQASTPATGSPCRSATGWTGRWRSGAPSSPAPSSSR